MTIPYTADVSTSGFRTSMRLLLKWRGSVYRLLWGECVVYVVLFAAISCVYRFALTIPQKRLFEDVVRYFKQYIDLIPVAFVLGFYVSVIVNRWWAQFMSIPWPDRMAVFLTSTLQGSTERARMMRRTIMRYFSLSFTMCFVSISPSVKKRFPTLEHVKNAGFIEDSEANILENMKTPYNKYFMPLVWAASLLTKARKENLIKDDFALKTLLDELNGFRGGLGNLLNYDWVNIPLVYTQVVILAVYLYFLVCLVGRQYIEKDELQTHNLGVYFPLFTCFQFVFYMGWLKVAESLLNPMGDDDDDFSVNELIDRNLPVSYLIVDEMHSEIPDLIKDTYWDKTEFNLPYTEATKHLITIPFIGSTLDVNVSSKLASVSQSNLETVMEDDEKCSIDTKGSINNPSLLESADGVRSRSNLRRISRRQNVPGTVFSSSLPISTTNVTIDAGDIELKSMNKTDMENFNGSENKQEQNINNENQVFDMEPSPNDDLILKKK